MDTPFDHFSFRILESSILTACDLPYCLLSIYLILVKWKYSFIEWSCFEQEESRGKSQGLSEPSLCDAL